MDTNLYEAKFFLLQERKKKTKYGETFMVKMQKAVVLLVMLLNECQEKYENPEWWKFFEKLLMLFINIR